MTFAQVAAVQIPEGQTGQILAGDARIWRLSLTCDPVLSIKFTKSYSSGRYNWAVTVTITGIDASLIQLLEVGDGYTATSSTGVTVIQYHYAARAYTTSGTTHTASKSYRSTSGSAYSNGFAARLTYTDLDGNTQVIEKSTS